MSEPCKGSREWDYDYGGIDEWVQAIDACASCPFLKPCRRALNAQFPGWGTGRPGPAQYRRNPHGVIWAGLVFSDDGHLVKEQEMRRAASAREASRRRHRRHSEDIRLGEVS